MHATKINPEPGSSKTIKAILKYIVLKVPGTAGERVVLFHTSLSHAQMLPAGLQAVSAGFCMLCRDIVIVPPTGSTTLNLHPNPSDQNRLAAFLGLAS